VFCRKTANGKRETPYIRASKLTSNSLIGIAKKSHRARPGVNIKVREPLSGCLPFHVLRFTISEA
jgi:hypothetical protein